MPRNDPIPEFDLYSELGVEFGADRTAIERAWRTAVRSVHPDRAEPDEERAFTDRTVRLNIAREWLTEPARRERYDELRYPNPHETATIPVMDPIGPWPIRPLDRGDHLHSFLRQAPVLVSVIVIALTMIAGVGSSVVTIVAFDLSAVTITYYGLYSLVGVVARRLRS